MKLKSKLGEKRSLESWAQLELRGFSVWVVILAMLTILANGFIWGIVWNVQNIRHNNPSSVERPHLKIQPHPNARWTIDTSEINIS